MLLRVLYLLHQRTLPPALSRPLTQIRSTQSFTAPGVRVYLPAGTCWLLTRRLGPRGWVVSRRQAALRANHSWPRCWWARAGWSWRL
jgi:hypothetical protein